jgi:hypothetical protein
MGQTPLKSSKTGLFLKETIESNFSVPTRFRLLFRHYESLIDENYVNYATKGDPPDGCRLHYQIMCVSLTVFVIG